MGKLIFIIIFQLIFLLCNVNRKEGWKNPSTLLFIIYFAISLLCIPHLLINGDSATVQYTLVYQDKYWLGTLAYVFFITLFLFPIYYFKENKIEKIKLPSLQVLNIFSAILIVLSLYSIVYFLPSVINMFRSGVALSALRDNLSTVRNTYVNTGGIANTIASASSGLYPFAAMLFYIYYILGKHRCRTVLLFISSTSGIVQVLSFVGRDGVVFWIFTFLFLYFVFKNYLNIKQRKNIKKIFLVGTILALIPFVAISISRFGRSSDGGTINSILAYVGQMVPNYLLYYSVRAAHYNYGTSFPLFWEIINKPAPNSPRWIDGGTESNVFGTFIKSYNINFGIWGTIIVGVLACIIFIVLFKKEKKTIYYHQYFIYILFFQLLSEGVFYFREYTRGGNLFILICPLLFIVFSIFEKRFGYFVLQKNDESEIRNKKRKRKIRFIIRQ